MINVLNDNKRGQALLDHAEDLEETTKRENEVDEEEIGGAMTTPNVDMFSDENALVTISGEKSSMCEIIHANTAFLSLFGFKRNDVIGVNIKKIIPNPIANLHDVLVAKYIETGFAKVIDRSRPVLCLNSSGHLFQIILCVKHVVDNEGKQSFVGIIKPSKQYKNSGFFILDDTFGMLHATENISSFFGFKPRTTASFKITAIFVGLTAERLTDKLGVKTTWIKNEFSYEIEIFGDKVSIGNLTCYICRIKFWRIPSGIGAGLSSSSVDIASSGGSNPMVFSPHGLFFNAYFSSNEVQGARQIWFKVFR
ncbi:hypothetical protein HK100_007699 [Physocladia obscura]|uniref:PAS domain-containing protein n=1 Tax=Physocladia obscura TaxID=109957 RepID=A0AAD5XBZ2_9FUNG|nr:hypothetical protein HK100_007699 [Physocladia obscura]